MTEINRHKTQLDRANVSWASHRFHAYASDHCRTNRFIPGSHL